MTGLEKWVRDNLLIVENGYYVDETDEYVDAIQLDEISTTSLLFFLEVFGEKAPESAEELKSRAPNFHGFIDGWKEQGILN